MGLFETMVQNMQRMEFFQYLFPFLLAFALLYGMMQWVFKENLGGKRVHTLIALVLSFFVMLYSSINPWLYGFLTNASGAWLGIAVILLFVVLATELLGLNIRSVMGGEGLNKWVKYAILLVIVYLIVVGLLGGSIFSMYVPWLSGSDLWTVVLVIIIIAVVFAFVGGEDKGSSAASEGEKK